MFLVQCIHLVYRIVRCDVDSSEVFHIIDNINIQLGPNWQPSTTKMTVARLRCNADSFSSVSYHWYYHIRSGNRQLCSVVPPTKSAQAISSIFSPKIQLGPNWQQSTPKMAVERMRCDADSFGCMSYHWYSHIRPGKRQICSVVPSTKSAQTISSIYSPKIQLGPNWQQSTTKMAVRSRHLWIRHL